jgi:hypothetical protein
MGFIIWLSTLPFSSKARILYDLDKAVYAATRDNKIDWRREQRPIQLALWKLIRSYRRATTPGG